MTSGSFALSHLTTTPVPSDATDALTLAGGDAGRSMMNGRTIVRFEPFDAVTTSSNAYRPFQSNAGGGGLDHS